MLLERQNDTIRLMKIETTGKKVIDEVPWGTYVYQCPDGEVLGDGDGNIMCILGFRNDKVKIQKMIDAAKYYGFTDGKVVFWSGQRPITDEEYEHQLARQAAGLVPDPLDIGALRDERRGKKNDKRRR